MGIMEILFILDGKKVKNFKYIGLFFLSYVIGRVCRLYSKFIIGYEYGDYQFEGPLFIFQFLYTIVTYFALFFVYYYGEKEVITKSHHIFTILVVVNTTLWYTGC